MAVPESSKKSAAPPGRGQIAPWARVATWIAIALLLTARSGAAAPDAPAARAAFLQNALPGAAAPDASLVAELRARWEHRPAGYKPRTRHLNPDGTPKYTNRLFLTSSPYLLQHAHNPVNWYPWGDEAFDAARKLGRPVLLSVGYSTCHWCHVMEEESFEDEEIARYLNENYVAIKVDREERPDIDAIYMTAVQQISGGGGWPMTVWLTADRKPFYGGTYFPARDGERGAGLGFLTLLKRVGEVYHKDPDRVRQSAEQLTALVRVSLTSIENTPGLPGPSVLERAAQFYRAAFDAVNGGTKGAPKFPSSLPVSFLLRYHRRTGDAASLAEATRTLEAMANGGIYDHVGGGFHRYSTDEHWLVPHFEKMLYDNALLAMAYLEAYRATRRDDFARVARETLRYVERDMTSPEGGFYSATDADSPTPGGGREEGWFYTWTPAEIAHAVGEERAPLIEKVYGVTEAGNFHGRSILHTPQPIETVAQELHVPVEKARQEIEAARDLMYQARAERPPPLRDEKILAAWNGLMIGAEAQAALAFADPHCAQVAARAADLVLAKLRRGDRLLRSYESGRAEHDAYLDDYAFLISGLLDLYEATSDPRWLKEAIDLDRVLSEHYEDRDGGGFYRTADDHETLLAREKPAEDGPEPSGNSIEVMNLLRLHELTADDRYRQRAERALRAFGGILERAPAALSDMLPAVDFYLDVPKEIVITTPSSRQEAAAMLDALRSVYVPNRVLSAVVAGDVASQSKLVPLLEGKIAQNGRPTAYVCEKHVCDLPTTSPEVFATQLRKVAPLHSGAVAAPSP